MKDVPAAGWLPLSDEHGSGTGTKGSSRGSSGRAGTSTKAGVESVSPAPAVARPSRQGLRTRFLESIARLPGGLSEQIAIDGRNSW